jgi:ADP-ribose pyrophosphatase YjhB (NUDIX family)
MKDTNPRARRASRLVVLDQEGRLLLFRHARGDGTSFWALPGGGVEIGETFEQAALREAAEELGLKGFPVRLLWQGVSEFLHVDGPVCQHECFFLLQGAMPPLSAELEETHKRENIVEMRWWPAAEIESTKEPVFPPNLLSELKKISN